ncbi:thioredoxin [Candidatus Peregrinibacteria bacterium CG11_big_fil_rev_8_21_14_0_20_46_8]|nr:MAG: thioredoxin [Candidatus Peregrinibacteria bacterium CG11_big_fil_rev_8_21_14_0_20_46_8]
MAHQLTDADFAEKTAKGHVLIDLYADWCGPCKMMAPIIDEISQEYEGKIAVYKLDVDQNQETPGKFGVSSIPVLVFMNDGEEVGRAVGFQSKDDLEDKFKELGWL